jgi:hypothetical protein
MHSRQHVESKLDLTDCAKYTPCRPSNYRLNYCRSQADAHRVGCTLDSLFLLSLISAAGESPNPVSQNAATSAWQHPGNRRLPACLCHRPASEGSSALQGCRWLWVLEAASSYKHRSVLYVLLVVAAAPWAADAADWEAGRAAEANVENEAVAGCIGSPPGVTRPGCARAPGPRSGKYDR